jgi:hypothetical protein
VAGTVFITNKKKIIASTTQTLSNGDRLSLILTYRVVKKNGGIYVTNLKIDINNDEKYISYKYNDYITRYLDLHNVIILPPNKNTKYHDKYGRYTHVLVHTDVSKCTLLDTVPDEFELDFFKELDRRVRHSIDIPMWWFERQLSYWWHILSYRINE